MWSYTPLVRSSATTQSTFDFGVALLGTFIFPFTLEVCLNFSCFTVLNMKFSIQLSYFRYCAEHARRHALLRQRAVRKRRPRETPETLLEQIEHYGTKTEELTGGRDIRRRPSVENLTNRLLGIFNDKTSLLLEQTQTLRLRTSILLLCMDEIPHISTFST